MSSTLRALAVASSTALIVAGFATSAGAAGSSSFTVSPTYGPVSSTITVHGTGFVPGETVTIGTSAQTSTTYVNADELTAVVPTDATSGPVKIFDGPTATQGPNFILQQQTTGSSTASKTKLTYTHGVTVTGTLTTTFNNAPVAGAVAGLQHQLVGSSAWHKASGTKTQKTNASGIVSWSVKPSNNSRYRVHFRASQTYTAATTASHSLKVLPKVSVDPVHTVQARTDNHITGTVHPTATGQVRLQKLVNGTWKRAGTATLDHSKFSFTVNPSSLGTLQYRVVRHADADHAYKATRAIKVQVINRNLVIGDSGSDVLALEKQLNALHYYIGTPNSTFGDDALHAVTAFEKVQGLTKDGEVTPAVYKALNHPKTIHLKYPHEGTYEVEVNIEKQVVLLGKDGKVAKILDTSTAGGYQYTNSEGESETAITPRGHFTFQYKLTGTRVSKLGTLYYPSYFTNTGYAIHGEGNGNDGGEVPPYANSHGCVRITDDAVLHYFSTPWLAVGTSVWVY